MKRYPGYSLDGVMIVLLSVMGFASHATHAEDENEQPVGIVKGTASLVHVDESGERTVIKGRPLNDVVVFLEPNGHTPPFTPQTNHAEIRQKRARFAPAFTVISKGRVIDFPNNDRILHNVFSYSPARTFDLGVYKKGESRAVQFDRPGPIELFCSIHSSMYAQIYVTPNPFFAVTDSDGAFLIENVPIGKYTLRTWNKRLPEGVESIEVRDIDVRVGAPVVISVEMGGS